jgi:hypothetical protein
MSELIGTLGHISLVVLVAVLGWTLLEMLAGGERLFNLNRVRSATFWSVHSVVTTIVVALTVRHALLG